MYQPKFKLLVALTLTLGLAACHKQGGQSSAKDPHVIKVWDVYVAQSPRYDEEIALFEKANPGLTVKRTVIQSDRYDDLLSLAFKSGDGPDFFMVGSKPSLGELAKQGRVYPLSDFADFKDAIKDLPKGGIMEGSNAFDGKVYSIDFPAPLPPMQLWVNLKAFREAGWVDKKGNPKIPHNTQEFLEACRGIKEGSKGSIFGYGYGGRSNTLSWQWHWCQLAGAPYDGFDFKTGSYIFGKHPAYRQMAQLLVNLKKEGLLLPESPSIDDESVRVLFAQGKFAMMTAGAWVVNGWDKTNPDFKDYTCVSLPLVGVKEPQGYSYAYGGAIGCAISAQAADPAAAWKFYRFLQSKEAMVREVEKWHGMNIYTQDHLDSLTPPMRAYWGLRNLVRLAPMPNVRNPGVKRVQVMGVKPDETGVLEGLLTGQITDVQSALQDLDKRKQAALLQGLEDAVKSGVAVSITDYQFPDWNPKKDYLTVAKH